MKRVLCGLIAVVVLACTFASSARAAGMEWPDNGTRSQGRAGAFVAKADDPSAIVLNPAGLTQVKGTNLLFDNNLIQQGLCFKRAGSYPGTPGPYTYAGQPYPEICRSLTGTFYVPMVSMTTDFGLRDWTFAFGGYGPHAVGRREFPMAGSVTDTLGNRIRAPGPTRYDTDAMNVTVLFFTLAAAYKAADWLSLGAALQIVYAEIDYAVWVPLSAAFDPDSDIRFHIHTKGVTATGILSALANPWRGLFLGLAVRLPVHADTKGDAGLTLPASMSTMGSVIEWIPNTHQAEMTTDLPLAIRGGIRYAWSMKRGGNAPDLVDIELDVVWERWSAIKTMDTKLNATLLGDPMAVFALNHFYQDTAEFRLGGSFTIPRKIGPGWLTLRLGTYYGSNASPNEYTRLNYASWARIGLAGGFSYRLYGIDLHAGFIYVWNGDGKIWRPWSFTRKRHVKTSCVEAINAFDPPEAVRCDLSSVNPNRDISSGTYQANYMSFSLGFSIRFDEMARSLRGSRAPTPQKQ